MSRIGASLGGFQLRLLNNLKRVNSAINQSNLRLNTGKRINSAADDPSGVMFLASHKTELSGVQAVLKNVQKATSLVDTADLILPWPKS